MTGTGGVAWRRTPIGTTATDLWRLRACARGGCWLWVMDLCLVAFVGCRQGAVREGRGAATWGRVAALKPTGGRGGVRC